MAIATVASAAIGAYAKNKVADKQAEAMKASAASQKPQPQWDQFSFGDNKSEGLLNTQQQAEEKERVPITEISEGLLQQNEFDRQNAQNKYAIPSAAPPSATPEYQVSQPTYLAGSPRNVQEPVQQPVPEMPKYMNPGASYSFGFGM